MKYIFGTAIVIAPHTTSSPVTQNTSASVGVNEIISFTITDNGGAAGVEFGGINPNTQDNNATPNPAVNLTAQKETNVAVNVSTNGDNFISGANTLNAGNATYNDQNNAGNSTQLTTSFAFWYQAANTNADQTRSVFYWIDIPLDQPAGDYASTFRFKAEKA